MSNLKVQAIVVCCVQADLFGDFLNFITEDLDLKMGTFAPICIPGGPTPLAHPERLEPQNEALDHYIGFCRLLYPEAELICIAHKGCKYHEQYAPSNGGCGTDSPKTDLPAIKRHYPKSRTYYLRKNLQTGRMESS